MNGLFGVCAQVRVGDGELGNGFFVAPGVLITCAHVVGRRASCSVRWDGRDHPATVRWRRPSASPPDGEWTPLPDVALLDVEIDDPHPYADVERAVPRDSSLGGAVRIAGYQDAFGTGRPILVHDRYPVEGTPSYDGRTLVQLGEKPIEAGMSGSPAISLRSGRVIGPVKTARLTARGATGGWVVPLAELLADEPELLDPVRGGSPAWRRERRTWLVPGLDRLLIRPAARETPAATSHTAAPGDAASHTAAPSNATSPSATPSNAASHTAAPGSAASRGAASGSAADLLRPERGVVPFSGREAELAELTAWCGSPEPFALRLVTGPGGIGKTRLALRLIEEQHARGWVAGFLNLTDRVDPVGVAAEVRELAAALEAIDEPALVVADYGEDHEGLGALIRLLDGIVARGGAPVRLLVLAREAGGWWIQAGLRLPDHLRSAMDPALCHIALAGVGAADRRGEYERARAAFADVHGVVARARAAPGFDDGTPVLHLHAAALISVLEPGEVPASGVEAVDAVLRHEAVYWDAAAGSAGLRIDAGEQRRVVALMTLLGARHERQAAKTLRKVLGDPRDGVAAWAGGLYAGDGDDFWAPLRPDVLGERLVALVCRDEPGLAERAVAHAGKRRAGRALTVLARAGQHSPEAASTLVDVLAGDLRRLVPLAARLAPAVGEELGNAAAEAATRLDELDGKTLKAILDCLPDHFEWALNQLSLAIFGAMIALAEGGVVTLDDGELAAIRLAAARYLVVTGEHSTALELVEEVIASAGAADVIDAMVVKAEIEFETGQPGAAGATALAALVLLRDSDDLSDETIAGTCTQLGMLLMAQGQPNEAAALLEEAYRAQRAIGMDPDTATAAALTLAAQAINAAMTGAVEQALALAARAVEAAALIPEGSTYRRLAEAQAWHVRLLAASTTRDPARVLPNALAEAEELISELRDAPAGYLPMQALYVSTLIAAVETACRIGAHEKGGQWCDELFEVVGRDVWRESANGAKFRRTAHFCAAEVARGQNRLDDAEAHLRTAIASVRPGEDTEPETALQDARMYWTLGQVLAQRGNFRAAVVAGTEARQHIEAVTDERPALRPGSQLSTILIELAGWQDQIPDARAAYRTWTKALDVLSGPGADQGERLTAMVRVASLAQGRFDMTRAGALAEDAMALGRRLNGDPPVDARVVLAQQLIPVDPARSLTLLHGLSGHDLRQRTIVAGLRLAAAHLTGDRAAMTDVLIRDAATGREFTELGPRPITLSWQLRRIALRCRLLGHKSVALRLDKLAATLPAGPPEALLDHLSALNVAGSAAFRDGRGSEALVIYGAGLEHAPGPARQAVDSAEFEGKARTGETDLSILNVLAQIAAFRAQVHRSLHHHGQVAAEDLAVVFTRRAWEQRGRSQDAGLHVGGLAQIARRYALFGDRERAWSTWREIAEALPTAPADTIAVHLAVLIRPFADALEPERAVTALRAIDPVLRAGGPAMTANVVDLRFVEGSVLLRAGRAAEAVPCLTEVIDLDSRLSDQDRALRRDQLAEARRLRSLATGAG
ncbi:trypsin-like peptidase domain-containing protein [Actinoplanes sp. CA-131856]